MSKLDRVTPIMAGIDAAENIRRRDREGGFIFSGLFLMALVFIALFVTKAMEIW